ncbi:MAG: aminotransferase class V-fold PLP-dependent enzyme [Bacteroidota bacterium]|nr:aminotransferase class V-fold PLP-dependent enzyme [Bacteroidota bacterium]
MSTDWPSFRSLFPALADRVYLNTAGGGAMARSVADAARAYYAESVEMGDIGWDRWVARADKDRSDVAAFIGTRADCIAFLPNASLGFNILARTLSPGSRVLAVDQEFPSCTTPFIRAGCEVQYIATDTDGSIPPALLEKALDDSFDAFVISSVQYANGFRADLEAMGAICARHEALFMVDATQSIGAFPLNMEEDGIDALVFSGYKWATAGYGNAVLATGARWPDSDPPLVGWRSARDAYALENNRLDLLPTGIGHEMGHPPFPGVFAMAEALRLLDSQDVTRTAERILELTDRLVEGLGDRFAVRSNRKREARSGIVLIDLQDAKRVNQELKKQDIWTSARDGGLRVSIHGYNNTDDVDRFLAGLCSIVD